MIFRRALFLFFVIGSLFADERREKQLAALDLPSKITGEGWKRIGVRDHYGIDVPLLSLHGKLDSGCGEFYDLFPLIDWMQSMGMDILQLLPLNDTGEIVSPYSPLSFYALHPIYLTLDVLPYMHEAPEDFIADLRDLKTLNQSKRVQYYKVLDGKEKFLRQYVSHFQKKLIDRLAYQEFMHSASYWITDYALFKVLSNHFGSEWMKWPKEFQYPEQETLEMLKKQYASEMVFYQIVQFLCFEQLEKVRHYANSQRVFLIGDLTFLVDVNSSAVWLHPEFFRLDKSIGVPLKPDFPKGQYWGLPPYNWEAIEKSETPMLLERIRNFSLLYDMYRLDSCLSYFSQYEIPLNSSPKEGVFVPSNEQAALDNGKKILSSFVNEVKQFLPTAEAFSMTPSMLGFLEESGIMRLKTVVGNNKLYPRAPMIYNGSDQMILEIFMLSNHDNLPFRRWWYEAPDQARMMAKYYGWKYQKNLSEKQVFDLIQMTYNANAIFHINMLYDLIPPELSWPSQDEGINFPGTRSDTNWTYRFKLSVEELTTSPKVRTLATPPSHSASNQSSHASASIYGLD